MEQTSSINPIDHSLFFKRGDIDKSYNILSELVKEKLASMENCDIKRNPCP